MAGKKSGKQGAARKESRNEQISRVLNIIRDLSNGSADLYELAERYATTDRTIRRDLAVIGEVGIHLTRDTTDESPKARWSIERGGAALPALDGTHFTALTLALREAQGLRSTYLLEHFEDLSRKVERAIGPKGRESLRQVDQAFFSWDKFAWTNAPRNFVKPLLDACIQHRLCAVEYRAPSDGNRVKAYELLPLRLLAHQGVLYLHAWSPKAEKVLALNVNRFGQVTLTDRVMAPPPGYDPDALAGHAFGIFIGPDAIDYELHFDAQMAPYIEERQWHPTQKLTRLQGGGLKVEFTCVPSYEVSNWVASWRHHVTVVKPDALRDELVAYAEWLSSQYPASRGKPGRPRGGRR